MTASSFWRETPLSPVCLYVLCTCAHKHTYIHMYKPYAFVCTYMCVYVYTYTHICVCVCVCVCARTHTHTLVQRKTNDGIIQIGKKKKQDGARRHELRSCGQQCQPPSLQRTSFKSKGNKSLNPRANRILYFVNNFCYTSVFAAYLPQK